MEYVFPIIVAVGVLFFVLKRGLFSSSSKKLSAGAENAQLIKVLVNLEQEPLEELFQLYERQFGEGAARYARQTYTKWKAGEVRPNRQTFRRFLIHLPKVMSFDLKCEVLREFRETYCPQQHYKATVYADDWRQTLTPLVESLIHKGNSSLPAKLSEKLSWLAEDDMQVADALLKQSEKQQGRLVLSLLEQEFSNIEQLLDNAMGKKRVTHILRLPQGTITLNIKNR
jgi:hypothetical protein